MPVVIAARTVANSLVVENDRGGTHVHDKRSTIKEFLSRRQWGYVISDVFPLDPRYRN
jgi:hypothetical protein